jgi:hypothetical protein
VNRIATSYPDCLYRVLDLFVCLRLAVEVTAARQVIEAHQLRRFMLRRTARYTLVLFYEKGAGRV